jgi:seryl-tRNA synthetase
VKKTKRRKKARKRMRRCESDSDRDDEVKEVKRAMREARARKKSLESKMKGQLSRDAHERSELDIIIKSLREELDTTKAALSDAKYDLKEAKFEISQLSTKCTKLNEERKLLESVHHAQQLELQLKMESTLKKNEEKHHLISLETEKISRVAEKLVNDVTDSTGKSQILRAHIHLLEKLVLGIHKIKEINIGSSASHATEIKTSLAILGVQDMTVLLLYF